MAVYCSLLLVESSWSVVDTATIRWVGYEQQRANVFLDLHNQDLTKLATDNQVRLFFIIQVQMAAKLFQEQGSLQIVQQSNDAAMK